ncbi:MAG TPA: hypothetical protein VHW23_08840 [Kofleriaceae bacterium]|nr:hypothetical protein [Kofleriaceae bacterium]
MLGDGTAEAGHAHFSGGVHVSGGFRGSVGVHFARPVGRPFVGGAFHRPFFRPRVWVGGRWWWNYYWWWPLPTPSYYYPEYVQPSYGGTYYPVQPGVAAPGAVAVRPRREPLPVLGFGVFAGGTAVNGNHDASEVGVLARLRLTEGLLVEAEVAKDSFSGDVAACPAAQPGMVSCEVASANGNRTDRRIGGSLIWEIGARNSLAPYVLAGGGVQQAKVTSGDFIGADFTSTQDFGEVGVGLRLSLSRNFQLIGDIRAGRRWTIDTNQDVVPVARATGTINPPPTGNNNSEDYSRARVAAVVMF